MTEDNRTILGAGISALAAMSLAATHGMGTLPGVILCAGGLGLMIAQAGRMGRMAVGCLMVCLGLAYWEAVDYLHPRLYSRYYTAITSRELLTVDELNVQMAVLTHQFPADSLHPAEASALMRQFVADTLHSAEWTR